MIWWICFKLFSWRNIFLMLTVEEEVQEKRLTAQEIMLTCQRIQIIKLKKKKLNLRRKMRNVIKHSPFYYKQKKDWRSQHPNDCWLHTLTEWNFHKGLCFRDLCTHWTVLSIKPFLQLMGSHLNSTSAWLQSLLGMWECLLDVQGKQTRSRRVDSGADTPNKEVSYFPVFSQPAQP